MALALVLSLVPANSDPPGLVALADPGEGPIRRWQQNLAHEGLPGHRGHRQYVSKDCILRRIGGRKGRYNATLGWVQQRDGHGSWMICIDVLSPSSVVYSVGISTDISFDLSLTRQVGTHILCIDPTITTKQFLDNCRMARASAEERTRMRFVPFGLGVADHMVPLYKHGWQMSSMVPGLSRFERRPWMTAPLLRLESFMALFGHGHIDLLKMDIEVRNLRNQHLTKWHLARSPPNDLLRLYGRVVSSHSSTRPSPRG